MKAKRLTPARRRWLAALPPDYSPQGVGLAPELYAAALRFLFDRPIPQKGKKEWYWDDDAFEATALEWTRILTVLFAQAGADLAAYNDEQVGMGLNYIMNYAVSNVAYAVTHGDAPLDETLRMMQAMPALWRDCIGPRLASLHAPIGSSQGKLAFVCYMWFDVWTPWEPLVHEPRWRNAVWQVFSQMLDVPCREVQIAALHGIGHWVRDLKRQGEIDRRVEAFIASTDPNDQELRDYAAAARCGGIL